MVLYAMNTSKNIATGFSPFELRYARKPRTALEIDTDAGIVALNRQGTEEKVLTLTKQGAKDFIKNHRELITEAMDVVKLA
jgi:hypothetical protein